MRTVHFLLPRPLAVASLAALVLLPLFTACGGKGDKPAATVDAHRSPSANPLATVPEGFWHGTLKDQAGQSHEASCLVLASGETRVVAKDNFLMSFKLDKGHGEGQYMNLGINTFKPGGAEKIPASFTVTHAQPQKAFSGHHQVGSDKGTFSFDTYGVEYDNAIEPAALAGNYSGPLEIHQCRRLEAPRGLSVATYKTISIVLGADGTLSGGQPEAFHIQGTYSLPSKDKAGIQLTFTRTPAEGKGPVEQFQGQGVVTSEQGKRVVSLAALGEHDGLIVGSFTATEAIPAAGA